MEPSDLSYLDLLPDEMVLQIMLKMTDLNTLNSWCQINKRINIICQDEGFWRKKYQQNYGDLPSLSDVSWKEKYKHIYLSNLFSPISLGGNHYGMIDENGKLYLGGGNEHGQLGNGKVNSPGELFDQILIPFDPKIIQVVCTDDSQTAAVTENGDVYLWGKLGLKIYSRPIKLGAVLEIEFEIGESVRRIILGKNRIILINENHQIYLLEGILPKIRKVTLFPILATDSSFSYFRWVPKVNILATDGKIFTYTILPGTRRTVSGIMPIFDENPMISEILSPEPVRQISSHGEELAILTISGKVYSLIPYQTFKNLFPKPISFISLSRSILAGITENGELYYRMHHSLIIETFDPYLKGVIIVKMEISHPSTNQKLKVNYVSAGYPFNLAVTEDGWVNKW